MAFFPEIDTEKTKANAEKKLREYHRYRRILGEPIEQKVTTTFSFMPRQKHQGGSDRLADLVAKKVDAEKEFEDIRNAINRIGDAFAQQILIMRYCQSERVRDKEIYMELGYSETDYGRLKNKALLWFAESYQKGCLIEFLGGN